MIVQQGHDAFYRDSKYRCCCNSMHVEKGAYYIAFLGALFSAVVAIAFFFTLNWPMVIVYCISLFVFLSVIWAQKKHNPNLYLPFLIINGFGLLMTLANLLFLIVAIIVLPEFYTHYIRDTYDNYVNQPHRHDYAYNTIVYFVFGVAILITAVALAIYAWFYSVVLHAYKYMKDVQTVKVTSIPIGGGQVMHSYQAPTLEEIQQKA